MSKHVQTWQYSATVDMVTDHIQKWGSAKGRTGVVGVGPG